MHSAGEIEVLRVREGLNDVCFLGVIKRLKSVCVFCV